MNLNIEELLSYGYPQLVKYLTLSAGLSNPNFEGVVGAKDNLQLQQIPREYAHLLMFLKEYDAKSYLELGIGQGGSFLLNSIFQTNLKVCHCVDGCNYQKDHATAFFDQYSSINNKIKYLAKLKPSTNIIFFNHDTDNFFNKVIDESYKYDIIFIDADHSYEGVLKDYNNALKHLNDNGLLIFHDIANETTGVKKMWESLKSDQKVIEFVNSTKCGIGVYKP